MPRHEHRVRCAHAATFRRCRRRRCGGRHVLRSSRSAPPRGRRRCEWRRAEARARGTTTSPAATHHPPARCDAACHPVPMLCCAAAGSLALAELALSQSETGPARHLTRTAPHVAYHAHARNVLSGARGGQPGASSESRTRTLPTARASSLLPRELTLRISLQVLGCIVQGGSDSTTGVLKAMAGKARGIAAREAASARPSRRPLTRLPRRAPPSALRRRQIKAATRHPATCTRLLCPARAVPCLRCATGSPAVPRRRWGRR